MGRAYTEGCTVAAGKRLSPMSCPRLLFSGGTSLICPLLSQSPLEINALRVDQNLPKHRPPDASAILDSVYGRYLDFSYF